MPYIKPEDRHRLLDNGLPKTPGEFNFVVTVLADCVIEEKGLSYTTVNEIIGALECIKLELYRRVAAPYEDRKIIENGDVYSKEHVT